MCNNKFFIYFCVVVLRGFYCDFKEFFIEFVYKNKCVRFGGFFVSGFCDYSIEIKK